MKIAVTCENGTVFQHFGHTPEFAVYDCENGQIVSFRIVSSGDSGHGALAGLLDGEHIDVLICGGIGGGAINALSQYGIQVVGGAEGSVEDAVRAYLAGNLVPREGFMCAHHDHGEGHACGDHGCGSHEAGHGNHGCGGGSCH